MMTAPATCTCPAAAQEQAVQDDLMLRPLLPGLVPWLTGRRWFTHEYGCLEELAPVSGTAIRDEQSAAVLLHLLVDARYPAGPSRRYQLVLGLRPSLPPELADAAIGRAAAGPWDQWWIYEATEDPALMALLLSRTVDGRPLPGLRLSTTSAATRIPVDLPARALAVEQSNSTVVFGDQLLLKLFRQPQPGPHPETEVLTALTRAGSRHTPRLAGWLHTPGTPEESTVLGIFEDFLVSDGDGWELAVDQAEACLSSDRRGTSVLEGFTRDAHALGLAVAEVHRSLATALGTVRLTTQQILDQIADMDQRLRRAAEAVPSLAAHRTRIGAIYDDYARVALQGHSLDGQRIHGDLHLGQVLRSTEGWKIIDFEGEPARPISERNIPQSPLRDVAGMLRSFDYAAQHALAETRAAAGAPGSLPERLRQERRAQAWTVRNRRAFCDGYAEAGSTDPRVHPIAMRAFEVDKAVYEAAYEAAHRPQWLPVPMAAIERVISSREASSAVPGRVARPRGDADRSA